MMRKLVICAALSAFGTASAVTIDDFSEDQAILFQGPVGTTGSTQAGAGMVGGERDIEIEVTGASSFHSASVGTGLLNHAQGPSTFGTTTVTWDGVDGDETTLDATGLGGVDLTDGGIHNAIAISLFFADSNAVMDFNVYTDGANASTLQLALPGGANNELLILPFSDFTTLLGAGADFTNVGAIEMFIDGSATAAVDVQVELLEGVATLSGSKDDALIVDVDVDGEPGPGDTIEYTVVVTNNDGSAAANNVVLTDTVDADTDLECTSPAPTTTQGTVSTCNSGFGGDLQVDIGTIAAGASVTVVFQVDVGPGVNGSDICNQGVLNSDNATNVLTFDLDNPQPDTETCWTATPVDLQSFSIE